MTTTSRSRRTIRIAAAAVAAVAVVSGGVVAATPGPSPAPAPASAPSAPVNAEPLCPDFPEVGFVDRVVDGDTLVVDAGCDAPFTVRVIGMNTAETVKPRSPVQCWGPQGSAFAHRELGVGDRIGLEWDAGPGYTDRYGRRLAHVFVLKHEAGAELYALEAIRAGVAEANNYGRPHHYLDQYRAAQAEAKSKRLGAWGHCPNPFKA